MITGTSLNAIILAGFDAYDMVARRRQIATLDEEAKKEAIDLAVEQSEQGYKQDSDQLGNALEASAAKRKKT